jgi:hypothetical protein
MTLNYYACRCRKISKPELQDAQVNGRDELELTKKSVSKKEYL